MGKQEEEHELVRINGNGNSQPERKNGIEEDEGEMVSAVECLEG